MTRFYKTQCVVCGQDLPYSKRADTLTCSAKCRKAKSRKSHLPAPLVVTKSVTVNAPAINVTSQEVS